MSPGPAPSPSIQPPSPLPHCWGTEGTKGAHSEAPAGARRAQGRDRSQPPGPARGQREEAGGGTAAPGPAPLPHPHRSGTSRARPRDPQGRSLPPHPQHPSARRHGIIPTPGSATHPRLRRAMAAGPGGGGGTFLSRANGCPPPRGAGPRLRTAPPPHKEARAGGRPPARPGPARPAQPPASVPGSVALRSPHPSAQRAATAALPLGQQN